MKEVWEHYNKRFKYRTHVKINLDSEQEHEQFIQFWCNLYKDNLKNIDMAAIKDDILYNYPTVETEGPTFEEINEILQNINVKKATSGIIKP